MKFQFVKGETSVILVVFIQDSSATDGSGLGSLDQSSSITGGYVKRNGTGVALSVNQNVTTEGTYEAPSTAAQVRIGTPANMPTGFYELHFHNDLFTTADYVTIGLGGATNMAPLNIEIQLTDVDLNDGVRSGLTALPNAVADAAGGLPISDAGGLDLDTILDAAITTRATPAQVNAEVVDAINVDTYAEPGRGAPAATNSIVSKISYLYKAWRNRTTQSNSGSELYNDAGDTIDQKSTDSDDGTTRTSGEMVSGP